MPGILGFCPCWCPSRFPSPSMSRCFSIHSSSPAIGFHSCFFFTTDVFARTGRPIAYSLFRLVSRLGIGFGIRCCGLTGGAEVRMKLKSRFKFLPWPGFEPQTLLADGRERYHLTTAHPTFKLTSTLILHLHLLLPFHLYWHLHSPVGLLYVFREFFASEVRAER